MTPKHVEVDTGLYLYEGCMCWFHEVFNWPLFSSAWNSTKVYYPGSQHCSL